MHVEVSFSVEKNTKLDQIYPLRKSFPGRNSYPFYLFSPELFSPSLIVPSDKLQILGKEKEKEFHEKKRGVGRPKEERIDG